MKKYELTNETKVISGVELHRIKALKDFGSVKKGDLGGWIDDMEIGDGMSIEEIKIVCKRIGKLNTEELYILNAIYEALEDIEKALDCYESDKYVYYGCITMKEVAQEFLSGAHTIPSYFKKHIDYKSIARDMLNNGYYITDYGVIEII